MAGTAYLLAVITVKAYLLLLFTVSDAPLFTVRNQITVRNYSVITDHISKYNILTTKTGSVRNRNVQPSIKRSETEQLIFKCAATT